MRTTAIILAGGVGSRVGADIPKQFIKILGKPILCYTIDAFEENENVDFIEIVCHKNYIDYLKDTVKNYGYKKVIRITEGGDNFQHSAMNGINDLADMLTDSDIALIHYGVSPFVDRETINNAISVCKEKGNATPASKCYLLVGTNDGDRSEKRIDRDGIMILNAPHAFKFGYLKSLYKRAADAGILETTEPYPTSLMYRLGDTVYLSKGSQNNIKITTKEDIDMFEGYVLMKEKRKAENKTEQ